MGVSRRDRLPASLFMGLVLFVSPMIGRALAADTGQSPSVATPSSAGEASPLNWKTSTPARAWEVAFAAGSSSVSRDLKADSPIQLVQGAITVTPNTVDTGASNTVTITTSGFFDLSQVTPSQISVRPADGVSNFAVADQSAQRLTLSFDVADTATPGIRTLSISNSTGGPGAALDLTLKLGQNVCMPACVSPSVCENNQCITHTPPPPPAQCNPQCEGESSCINGRCVDKCDPHCAGGKVCVNDAGHLICKNAD